MEKVRGRDGEGEGGTWRDEAGGKWESSGACWLGGREHVFRLGPSLRLFPPHFCEHDSERLPSRLLMLLFCEAACPFAMLTWQRPDPLLDPTVSLTFTANPLFPGSALSSSLLSYAAL